MDGLRSDADVFYVNVATPALIVVADARDPTSISRSFAIPVGGPHGLDLDRETCRLFCACNSAQLVTLGADTGGIQNQVPLSAAPDVIFHNPGLNHLYVAIGDPGVIDVIDTDAMKRVESIATERGAHTIAFETTRNKVYAFLPESHRAAVYLDVE